MIDEGIEARWRVNVHLRDGPIEEVLQRSTSFVLRIEVEQCERNLVSLEPLRQRDHQSSLADPAFAAHCENDAFVRVCCLHRDPPWQTSFNGSLSSK
jgi:hypothetical protein